MTRARNLSGFSSALSSTQDINTTGIITAVKGSPTVERKAITFS